MTPNPTVQGQCASDSVLLFPSICICLLEVILQITDALSICIKNIFLPLSFWILSIVLPSKFTNPFFPAPSYLPLNQVHFSPWILYFHLQKFELVFLCIPSLCWTFWTHGIQLWNYVSPFHSNVCVGSGSVLIFLSSSWIVFSCFWVCLVTFDWMSGIVFHFDCWIFLYFL